MSGAGRYGRDQPVIERDDRGVHRTSGGRQAETTFFRWWSAGPLDPRRGHPEWSWACRVWPTHRVRRSSGQPRSRTNRQVRIGAEQPVRQVGRLGRRPMDDVTRIDVPRPQGGDLGIARGGGLRHPAGRGDELQDRGRSGDQGVQHPRRGISGQRPGEPGAIHGGRRLVIAGLTEPGRAVALRAAGVRHRHDPPGPPRPTTPPAIHRRRPTPPVRGRSAEMSAVIARLRGHGRDGGHSGRMA